MGVATSTNRVAVVLGSARNDGNAAAAARHVCLRVGMASDLIDLSECKIGPFDYSRHDDRDDFRSVIARLLDATDIVFVTPIYWYAMSGMMKTFFDRLTDLLLDPQDRLTGRDLAGRRIWLLATGTDDGLPAGFEEPFRRTAAYFDMTWHHAGYLRVADGVIADFADADRLVGLIEDKRR